jgi:hypothetical protein
MMDGRRKMMLKPHKPRRSRTPVFEHIYADFCMDRAGEGWMVTTPTDKVLHTWFFFA